MLGEKKNWDPKRLSVEMAIATYKLSRNLSRQKIGGFALHQLRKIA